MDHNEKTMENGIHCPPLPYILIMGPGVPQLETVGGIHVFSVGGWGARGGTRSGKGCQLRSDRCGVGGCRNARWLKKRGVGAVLLLYCKIRELSESLHPIFYYHMTTVLIQICS